MALPTILSAPARGGLLSPGKKSRIVVIAPGEPVEFFGLLWDGVKSASAEISSLGLNVDYIVTSCHDVDRQREILAGLLETAPDAIALIPAHSSALDDLIEEHTSRGASVVTFNADAPQSTRCSYIGPDAPKSGALAAEVLTKLMATGNAVAAFPGSLEKGHLASRYQGFIAELAKWRPDVRVAVCHVSQENEGRDRLRAAAAGLIAAHPEIAGIYVGNSRAYDIGAALESLGLRIPCVGFDNTPAVRPFLETNLVSAVIDQNAYQQGYVAVQRAYETLSVRRRRLTRSTLIPSTVVFASNASDPAATDTLNEAFELLVRRRTARLRSYQRMLQEANHQLLHLAETDALTGLFNRRKIEYLLDDHLARCSFHAPVSLLMIDVNQFKVYNDSCGHETGDEALRVLARVLTEQVRSPDCCGRFGGDEFCIVLPNTDHAGAAALRVRLDEAVAAAIVPAHTGDLPMKVSIGIATAPADGTTPHELLRIADRSMYADKNRETGTAGQAAPAAEPKARAGQPRVQ